LLYDFYWGMELYPRIGGAFDIKTWTNCRMGMAGWASLCWAFAAANGRDNGTGIPTDAALVTATLINVYLFKFFVWEPGYWASMDIAHDRAGYYICWGCLVWVPAVYASPSLFLGGHPAVTLGTPLAAAVLLAGLLAIWVNYDADRQRQVFRATGGKEAVWGKAPVKIVASYTDGRGATRRSLLLASGWWGLARHFHYVPEIAAAALWTAPCGSPLAAPLAWFYVFFLTVRETKREGENSERALFNPPPRFFIFISPPTRTDPALRPGVPG
jgi:7-dehydrocholesterol reductase